MKKISVIIRTYDDSCRIEQVLRSVSWCDEIIVVDSGSSDDTVSKAESFGARVFVSHVNGIGFQKSFGVTHAKNNWILSVDVDEEISETLQKSILSLPEECRMSGYYIKRVEKFAGKLLEHSQLCHSLRMRLFDRRKGNFSVSTAKESVEIEGRTGLISGVLIHDRYESLAEYFQIFDRETSRVAKIRFDQGKRTSTLETLLHFPSVLFQSLFCKGAFLDGYEGILRAVFHSLFTLVKYAKLLELQRESRH